MHIFLYHSKIIYTICTWDSWDRKFINFVSAKRKLFNLLFPVGAQNKKSLSRIPLCTPKNRISLQANYFRPWKCTKKCVKQIYRPLSIPKCISTQKFIIFKKWKTIWIISIKHSRKINSNNNHDKTENSNWWNKFWNVTFFCH